MDISITGIALNSLTFAPSPFALSFVISGGALETAGCQSALMNATVSNFTAEVGNNVQALPTSFGANITTTPYPTCGDQGYGELVGGPLTLESQGPLLIQHARLFDGNIGSWYIETAQLSIASVPEPGTLALLMVAWLCSRAFRRSCVRR